LKTLYFFFILVSFSPLPAQTVSGVVYNSNSTIEDIKIENLSNKDNVFTNNKGEFTITATAKDTLEISSLFYIPQKIIVKPIFFKEVFVIELKKTKNILDEVKINGTTKDKAVNIIKVQANMRNQILEDIKNRPHLYGKAPSGNLDFIKIKDLIGKLFKKKYKDEPFTPIYYKDIEFLFNNNHKLFNDTLLTKTLKIKKENKFLFFEFVEAKSIDSKLLVANKELVLLEEILVIGNEFNTIINKFNTKNND